MSDSSGTNDGPGRVVVGVDDSEAARNALRFAVDIARPHGWRLVVVHAWHMNYPVVPYAMEPPDYSDPLREQAKATLHKVTREVLGGAPGIDVEEVVSEGPAASVLLDASLGAELLVVGSRGRGGFASLALGSVSTACVHHAPCPVLVVRPRDPAFAAETAEESA